ncbi:MAG: IPT/TIG domain-containing protein, partial [Acidobacteriota bacterium]
MLALIAIVHASTTYQTTSSLTYTGTAINYWYFNTGGTIPVGSTVTATFNLQTNYDLTAPGVGGDNRIYIICKNSGGGELQVESMGSGFQQNQAIDVSACFAGYDPSSNGAGNAYLCTSESWTEPNCKGWSTYGNQGTVFNSISLTVTPPVSTPTATTSAATSLNATGATLNGTVNDNGAITSVTFDYGTDNSYGTNVAASTGGTVSAGTGSTSVAKTLSSLSCNTTYHFRVKGVNRMGTTNGSDATFTTSACAPTVTAISPTSDTTAGGLEVALTGTNLTGATGVTFGGTAATNVVVVSATSITATTPAHAAGAVNVVVTTAGGSGTLTNGFTYVAAPTVT